ncbi:LacI family DNA-binding transcriptional regulator [Bacillus carboniphilus]|uniref:LacI family DNA-binding transcriptional regulator n=1 Tax=Bacillus carboniphilus TaxID=86663 RepID=A0ABY9JX22_9BACI|nr:LacI family DNA-binding transcriptional regulator [Bacillus carboniphilus]WLR42858.1 LacI family DNA-binding transcriptional regulator [Bacillus carboniphilus]
MATIEDVAKLAGLSRTTVSRVINNHPYVSQTKRQQVLHAMKELGYVPNSSARSLRNQRTGIIAVLIPRVTNLFFSKFIETLEITISKSDYQLIVCQTQYSKEKELTYLDLLKTRQIDGVIMASLENDWKEVHPYLQYGPIILVNEYEEKADVPTISLNQKRGAYEATEHLIKLGHKRIAYCCGQHKSNVAKEREKGFKQALIDYQLIIDEELTYRKADDIESGREIIKSIIHLQKPPTAIFTGSDEVAAGIIAEAKRVGWSIPENLAVVGFDNQPIAELLQPPITTVHQPVQEMAEKAALVLFNKIHNKVSTEILSLPLKLIIRASTVGEESEVKEMVSR